MPKQKMNSCVCDLCDRETTTPKEVPEGWIEISWENPQLDRDFIDKIICGRCIGLIEASILHSKKVK